MADGFDPRLGHVGEAISRQVRYTREDIAHFAQLTLDENPLHRNAAMAQRTRFGEIVASGQQTAALLTGMLATHFSRSDDGLAREMLCLNMNFAFKGPVFAEQDIVLRWRVTNIEPSAKLNGLLAHLDGSAAVARGKPLVVARGTILLTVAGE